MVRRKDGFPIDLPQWRTSSMKNFSSQRILLGGKADWEVAQEVQKLARTEIN